MHKQKRHQQHQNSHRIRKLFSKVWKNKYLSWAKINIFKWVKRV